MVSFIKQSIEISNVTFKETKQAMSKISLVESVIGMFAFDEHNNEVAVIFFPYKVEAIVEALEKLRRGEIVDEAVNLINGLVAKGYKEYIIETGGLAKAVKENFNIEVSIETSSKAGEYLRKNLSRIAVEKNFIDNLNGFYRLLHDVSIAWAKRKIKKALGRRDLVVSQAVFILDDLDKSFNLFTNRLREWYGYHFPELGNLIETNVTYVQLVTSLGERRNFTMKNLIKHGLNPQLAKVISISTKASMGTEINERDCEEIRSFSKVLRELVAFRDQTGQYLDDLMREVAPNTRELAGSALGARLIAAAGGLENLAKKSSGTIQILGAEKAFFRFLKTGSRPPKHGLIFQHKVVHQSSKWQRGKIARALAAKLAIAARLDAYGGSYCGDELKREFDERVKEIKAKYIEPSRRGKS